MRVIGLATLVVMVLTIGCGEPERTQSADCGSTADVHAVSDVYTAADADTVSHVHASTERDVDDNAGPDSNSHTY